MDYSKYEFKPKENLLRYAMIPLQLRNYCTYEIAKVEEWLDYCKKNGMSYSVKTWFDYRKIKNEKR